MGVFNFVDNIEQYNICLLEAEPGDPVDDGTFWVINAKVLGMSGFKMAGFAAISVAQ